MVEASGEKQPSEVPEVIPLSTIHGAVIASYIATRVQLTPHGIGQSEMAFALALYMGGVGFPEAGTLALVDGFFRHGTGLAIYAFARRKVSVSFSAVRNRWLGVEAS